VFGFFARASSSRSCAVDPQRKLLGRRNFSLKGQEFPTQEILSSFVSLYYDLGAFNPDEILLPEAVDDAKTKSEWLSEKRGERHGVEVMTPQRGSATTS